VSYLSETVSTSRFGICKKKNISLGSEREIPQFWVFWPFSLSPTNSGYFSHVLSQLLPSKIVANIIGDEYGPILIIEVFGFWPFWAVFGHFWTLLAFLGFQWRFGGIGSASEL
jgi:hypothetical protein